MPVDFFADYIRDAFAFPSRHRFCSHATDVVFPPGPPEVIFVPLRSGRRRQKAPSAAFSRIRTQRPHHRRIRRRLRRRHHFME